MTDNPDWSAKADTPPTNSVPPPGGAPQPYSYPPGPAPGETYPPGSYPGGYPAGPYPGGYPPSPTGYGEYPGMPVAPRNGLGVAALVIGILALVGAFTVAGGIILGTVAVVLGFLGRGRVRRGEANNGGTAMAGIVLGVLAVVASLVAVAFWVGIFNEVGAGDYFECLQQAGQDRTKVQECAETFRQSVENRFTVTTTPVP